MATVGRNGPPKRLPISTRVSTRQARARHERRLSTTHAIGDRRYPGLASHEAIRHISTTSYFHCKKACGLYGHVYESSKESLSLPVGVILYVIDRASKIRGMHLPAPTDDIRQTDIRPTNERKRGTEVSSLTHTRPPGTSPGSTSVRYPAYQTSDPKFFLAPSRFSGVCQAQTRNPAHTHVHIYTHTDTQPPGRSWVGLFLLFWVRPRAGLEI